MLSMSFGPSATTTACSTPSRGRPTTRPGLAESVERQGPRRAQARQIRYRVRQRRIKIAAENMCTEDIRRLRGRLIGHPASGSPKDRAAAGLLLARLEGALGNRFFV